jgi:hypothetical protein
MDALLDDLEQLAHERSRDRRATLLRRLTDLFFRGEDQHGDDALALFEDVICRVLAEVDLKARIELSDRMAYAARAPRRVVATLARDEVPVAEPVLRHSPALTDQDLVEIAAEAGPAHRAVMSRRVFVSELVTDALLARGEPDVRRALAGNDGAQITDGGFKKLIDGASGDHVLQELMALRANLPEPVKKELLPRLAAEVRRRVAHKLVEQAEPIIASALDAELDVIVGRAGDMSKDRLAYVDLQVAYDEGVITLDEALRQACRLDRHDWVVDLLAFAGPLDRARALQCLLERDPKPIAVLFKSHGLARETFGAVLDLRAKHLRVGSNAPKLVDDYAKLDVDVAHTVLRHLRARGGGVT